MGSSPRVRGALEARQGRGRREGIIPACAGSTLRPISRIPVWEDHPRVCGEHELRHIPEEGALGSSPRVRGARVVFAQFSRDGGIIPACAGSTHRAASFRRGLGDHPRVCGEHERADTRRSRDRGSSPRVRGAPGQITAQQAAQGIIPACAGSTRRAWSRMRPPRDHPRVCGEHMGLTGADASAGGSSPRVRGARHRRRGRPRVGGIIPACAGSTRARLRRRWPMWDHPRVCGEHYYISTDRALVGGSSPRVRGARGVEPGAGEQVGIIPACAGSTRTTRPTSASSRDHPRVCGEHA